MDVFESLYRLESRQPHVVARLTSIVLWIRVVLVLSLLSLSASSCSQLIFEDRTECPTYVMIKAVPWIDPRTWEELGMAIWEDGVNKESVTTTVYELNRGFYVPGTKGKYFEAALLGGWPSEWRRDGYLGIPEGEECPEGAGAYFGLQLGIEEIYEMPLELTQLYANVFFDVEGAESGYAFDFYVDGVVDGYMYPGESLHYGPFHAKARTNEYRTRAARIPRQLPVEGFSRIRRTKAGDGKDDGYYDIVRPEEALEKLYADIYIENATSGMMKKYLTLPLGKIITDNGYDWSPAQLEDIHVRIRMFNGSIASLIVSVADWQVVVIGDGKYRI